MKKKRILGLAAMMFSAAGLVACGGTPDASDTTEHKHDYQEVTEECVAATCTTEGKKVTKCTVCGDKKETKVSKKAHTWEEVAAESKAATCLEAGKKVQKCSVCSEKKETAIEALGHSYVKAADQSGAKAPTCTEAGTEKQECERCKDPKEVEVAATGHTWGETTWTSAATCEAAGVGSHKCETCATEEAVSEEALGHDVQLVGDETEAPAGQAKVRVYTCQRTGCSTSYLGFKANEVTDASKEHLVIGDDGGARFFGRPIGNDLELDPETGDSINQQGDELVFNENQTGDFFEYVFTLTAEQAATLQNCWCYCDAKPAGYMSSNRLDFWAYGRNSTDWTPGAYVEGENKGTIIDDYRYVLYVDDVRQEFDPDMTAKVPSGDPRQEYIMPYTFKLHEGTNKIRLVMSGGYRSTFYNFTFRAANPHQHNFTYGDEIAAAEGLCAYKEGSACSCEKSAIYMEAGADLNGKLTTGGKLPKGTSGNYDGTAVASYKFNIATKGKGKVYAIGAFDAAGNDKASYYHGKVSGSMAKLDNNGTNTLVKMNGHEVILPTTTYGDLLGTTNANDFKMFQVGIVDLIQGTNELTLAATNSYGLLYNAFIIVF